MIPSPDRFRSGVPALCLGLLWLAAGLSGCAGTHHKVLAATGTNIGVEITQNPATQAPTAKLGYQRTELAIVPTNRSGEPATAGSAASSARDAADVVMELRYGGIFDLGATSGIYQRLAVGTTAVQQPGAAFMFAKGADGKLDPEAAAAVARAQEAVAGLPEREPDVKQEQLRLLRRFRALVRADPANEGKFDEAAREATKGAEKYERFTQFLADLRATVDTVARVKAELAKRNLE
jgi:hypothetical protein